MKKAGILVPAKDYYYEKTVAKSLQLSHLMQECLAGNSDNSSFSIRSDLPHKPGL